MRLEEMFTAEEIADGRRALAEQRARGGYEAGKWMVSALNREFGTRPGRFPARVRLRDITLRTTEQMPGLVNSAEERLEFLAALARAGVPEVETSTFRRGHTLEEMKREVATVKAIAPDCALIYGNPVKAEEIELASNAGYDMVTVWNATYLGKAMPMSAGAVYHRIWQGRDWRDLRFPGNAREHFERARRLIRAGVAQRLRVNATCNLLAYATDEYIVEYARVVAGEGAEGIIFADSSGGTGPEAFAHLVEAVLSAVPGIYVGVHAHNIYALGEASSIAGARAGAAVIEVSVNGYEVGPAGCQTRLAATATALEALYGVSTGIDLSQMAALSQLAATLTGWPVPWNEPVLGSGVLEQSNADEYEQEDKFDELIHSSLVVERLGAVRKRRIGVTTGPLNMWDKLDEIGLKVRKEHVEPILRACIAEMRVRRRALDDDEIRNIASRVIADAAAGAASS